jgi:hypothetical protein
MKVFKYKVKDLITINETLFSPEEHVYIENSKLFRQVFNAEKKFIGIIDKRKFEKLQVSLKLIAE